MSAEMSSSPESGTAATRAALIEAAIEVFRERGYEGTRLGELTRRAGLTTGAVYSSFENKDALLSEAVAEASDKAVDQPLYDGIGTPESPMERVRVVLGGILHAPDRDLHVEAMVATRRSPRFAALARARGKLRVDRMRELLGGARQAREVDPELDVDAVAYLLLSVLSGVALLDAAGLDRPDDEAWQQVVDRLVAGLR
jgi:TetR/AcrR family transcriptional regulator, repressor for uid operon